jgi:hypothetical protein
MLKVLFGSTVGVMALLAVVLTIVAVTGVLSFVFWNEKKTRKP